MPRIHLPGATVAARWNTYREHTVDDQRLAAAFFPDHTVVFADVDRGIAGWFRLDAELASLIYDDYDLRAEVMWRYDRGEYREANVPHPKHLAALTRSAREL